MIMLTWLVRVSGWRIVLRARTKSRSRGRRAHELGARLGSCRQPHPLWPPLPLARCRSLPQPLNSPTIQHTTPTHHTGGRRPAHEALQRLPRAAVGDAARDGQPRADGAPFDLQARFAFRSLAETAALRRPAGGFHCHALASVAQTPRPNLPPAPPSPLLHPNTTNKHNQQVDDDTGAAEDDEELDGLDLGPGGAGDDTAATKQQKSVRMADGVEGELEGRGCGVGEWALLTAAVN